MHIQDDIPARATGGPLRAVEVHQGPWHPPVPEKPVQPLEGAWCAFVRSVCRGCNR